MQWTLEQLRQFVAAAQAGSFSAAARQLGRAQSAVSTSVGLLEADLGVELFDRSRRNATLTPAGEVMLQEARELLRQAGGLEQRALAFAGGRDARLSIALDEALPHLVLGALLKELAERFPALELTQLNGTATEVADYLRQGRASLAFHLDRAIPARPLRIAAWATWRRGFSWLAGIRWPRCPPPGAATWPGTGNWSCRWMASTTWC